MFSNSSANKKFKKASYSDVLEDINLGNVDSLVLISDMRLLYVYYKDGSKSEVSILPNDQNIIRLSESSRTPLNVRDIREAKLIESYTANFTVSVIFILFVFVLIKQVLKLADKSISFITGKNSFVDHTSLNTSFDDIAGMPEALEEVREIVSFLKEPKRYTDIGAKIPRGYLLSGPPGTGKTLLAKAIAREADVPFLSLSGSEFVELFVGIGATRIKNLFLQAKDKSPSIIFIDEIDSIGRQRGYGQGGGHDEREQTLNQLLTEMDGFNSNNGVIVIAATNRIDVLDTALTRPGRFDRFIEVSLPDQKGRFDILSIHALSKPLALCVNLKDIALRTIGFSGAELSNLLNESAIIAARENKSKISADHINKSLDRIYNGASKTLNNSLNSKKIVAYNTIGRAIVASILPSSDKVDKISMTNSYNSLGGSIRFIPIADINDESLFTRKYLMNKLSISLGGRAAEEIVYGNSEITQLAQTQIHDATKLARKMVTKYGFSSNKSLLINTQENSLFASNFLRRKSYSANKTSKEVDSEIHILISEAYIKAKHIIKNNIYVMDELVEKLILEETITGKIFRSIISSHGLKIDP